MSNNSEEITIDDNEVKSNKSPLNVVAINGTPLSPQIPNGEEWQAYLYHETNNKKKTLVAISLSYLALNAISQSIIDFMPWSDKLKNWFRFYLTLVAIIVPFLVYLVDVCCLRRRSKCNYNIVIEEKNGIFATKKKLIQKFIPWIKSKFSKYFHRLKNPKCPTCSQGCIIVTIIVLAIIFVTIGIPFLVAFLV